MEVVGPTFQSWSLGMNPGVVAAAPPAVTAPAVPPGMMGAVPTSAPHWKKGREKGREGGREGGRGRVGGREGGRREKGGRKEGERRERKIEERNTAAHFQTRE